KVRDGVPRAEAEPQLDRKEGGTGTRAKGEEAKNQPSAAPMPSTAVGLGALGVGDGSRGLATGSTQGFGAGQGRIGGAAKMRAPAKPMPAATSPMQPAEPEFDTEAYAPIVENSLLA